MLDPKQKKYLIEITKKIETSINIIETIITEATQLNSSQRVSPSQKLISYLSKNPKKLQEFSRHFEIIERLLLMPIQSPEVAKKTKDKLDEDLAENKSAYTPLEASQVNLLHLLYLNTIADDVFQPRQDNESDNQQAAHVKKDPFIKTLTIATTLRDNLNFWQAVILQATLKPNTDPADALIVPLYIELPNTAGYVLKYIDKKDFSTVFAQPCFNINGGEPNNHSSPQQILTFINKLLAPATPNQGGPNLRHAFPIPDDEDERPGEIAVNMPHALAASDNPIAKYISLLSLAIHQKPYLIDDTLIYQLDKLTQDPICDGFNIFKSQVTMLTAPQSAKETDKQTIYRHFNPTYLTDVKHTEEKTLEDILNALKKLKAQPDSNHPDWTKEEQTKLGKTIWTYTGTQLPTGTNKELVVIENHGSFNEVDGFSPAYGHLTTNDFVKRGELSAKGVLHFIDEVFCNDHKNIDTQKIAAIKKCVEILLKDFISNISKECALDLDEMKSEQDAWNFRIQELKKLHAQAKNPTKKSKSQDDKNDAALQDIEKTFKQIVKEREDYFLARAKKALKLQRQLLVDLAQTLLDFANDVHPMQDGSALDQYLVTQFEKKSKTPRKRAELLILRMEKDKIEAEGRPIFVVLTPTIEPGAKIPPNPPYYVSAQFPQGEKTKPSSKRDQTVTDPAPSNWVRQIGGSVHNFNDPNQELTTRITESANRNSALPGINNNDELERLLVTFLSVEKVVTQNVKHILTAKSNDPTLGSEDKPIILHEQWMSLLMPIISGKLEALFRNNQIKHLHESEHGMLFYEMLAIKMFLHSKQPVKFTIDGKTVYVNFNINLFNLPVNETGVIAKAFSTRLEKEINNRAFYHYLHDTDQYLAHPIFTTQELNQLPDPIKESLETILGHNAKLSDFYQQDQLLKQLEQHLQIALSQAYDNKPRSRGVKPKTEELNLAELYETLISKLKEYSEKKQALGNRDTKKLSDKYQEKIRPIQDRIQQLETSLAEKYTAIIKRRAAIFNSPQARQLTKEQADLIQTINKARAMQHLNPEMQHKIRNFGKLQSAFNFAQRLFFNQDYQRHTYILQAVLGISTQLIERFERYRCKSAKDRAGFKQISGMAEEAFYDTYGYWPDPDNRFDHALYHYHFIANAYDASVSPLNTAANIGGASKGLQVTGVEKRLGDIITSPSLPARSDKFNARTAKQIGNTKGFKPHKGIELYDTVLASIRAGAEAPFLFDKENFSAQTILEWQELAKTISNRAYILHQNLVVTLLSNNDFVAEVKKSTKEFHGLFNSLNGVIDLLQNINGQQTPTARTYTKSLVHTTSFETAEEIARLKQELIPALVTLPYFQRIQNKTARTKHIEECANIIVQTRWHLKSMYDYLVRFMKGAGFEIKPATTETEAEQHNDEQLVPLDELDSTNATQTDNNHDDTKIIGLDSNHSDNEEQERALKRRKKGKQKERLDINATDSDENDQSDEKSDLKSHDSLGKNYGGTQATSSSSSDATQDNKANKKAALATEKKNKFSRKEKFINPAEPLLVEPIAYFNVSFKQVRILTLLRDKLQQGLSDASKERFFNQVFTRNTALVGLSLLVAIGHWAASEFGATLPLSNHPELFGWLRPIRPPYNLTALAYDNWSWGTDLSVNAVINTETPQNTAINQGSFDQMKWNILQLGGLWSVILAREIFIFFRKFLTFRYQPNDLQFREFHKMYLEQFGLEEDLIIPEPANELSDSDDGLDDDNLDDSDNENDYDTGKISSAYHTFGTAVTSSSSSTEPSRKRAMATSSHGLGLEDLDASEAISQPELSGTITQRTFGTKKLTFVPKQTKLTSIPNIQHCYIWKQNPQQASLEPIQRPGKNPLKAHHFISHPEGHYVPLEIKAARDIFMGNDDQNKTYEFALDPRAKPVNRNLLGKNYQIWKMDPTGKLVYDAFNKNGHPAKRAHYLEREQELFPLEVVAAPSFNVTPEQQKEFEMGEITDHLGEQINALINDIKSGKATTQSIPGLIENFEALKNSMDIGKIPNLNGAQKVAAAIANLLKNFNPANQSKYLTFLSKLQNILNSSEPGTAQSAKLVECADFYLENYEVTMSMDLPKNSEEFSEDENDGISILPTNNSTSTTTTLVPTASAATTARSSYIQDHRPQVLTAVLPTGVKPTLPNRSPSFWEKPFFGLFDSGSEEEQIKQAKAISVQDQLKIAKAERSLIRNARFFECNTKFVKGDGNCLYHAFLDQLQTLEIVKSTFVDMLRKSVQNKVHKNKEKFAPFAQGDYPYGERTIDDFIRDVTKDGYWGDQIDIQALAYIFNVNVFIVRSDEISNYENINEHSMTTIVKLPNPQGTVLLGYHVGTHYYALSPKTNAAKEKIANFIASAETNTLLDPPANNNANVPAVAFFQPTTTASSSSTTADQSLLLLDDETSRTTDTAKPQQPGTAPTAPTAHK